MSLIFPVTKNKLFVTSLPLYSRMKKYQIANMKNKDQRMKAMNEVLEGIKVGKTKDGVENTKWRKIRPWKRTKIKNYSPRNPCKTEGTCRQKNLSKYSVEGGPDAKIYFARIGILESTKDTG
jgi:hypothetical protein